MVRGGIPGETLTATKGFIVLPVSKFRPLRQNVGLCERVRLKGDFDGEETVRLDRLSGLAGQEALTRQSTIQRPRSRGGIPGLRRRVALYNLSVVCYL
jgi:hypothetical protein